ncbi:MAG: pyridoxine 5'-phosphate synthase [Spirulinaceae cyanobacterium SM2_1_0]|nr:pyridoxine 5'-phosphate synthase [Spirulinaceae cyanobacterium SM2_1_0]
MTIIFNGDLTTVLTLGVNIDHVATIRQARRTVEPEPVAAATLAELAGADGITVHLREDRRHIQDRDVQLLRQTVRTHLNLEMAATDEMTEIALAVQPDYATIVPERREEVTTEGGLNLLSDLDRYRRVVDRLQGAGIPVSWFIDAEAGQIAAAAKTGAQFVELHTGRYAEAKGEAERDRQLAVLCQGCNHALDLGLRINAGHGLTYWNVYPVARLPGMEELNIGHSIISRAVLVGLERAVREMKQAMHGALGNL